MKGISDLKFGCDYWYVLFNPYVIEHQREHRYILYIVHYKYMLINNNKLFITKYTCVLLTGLPVAVLNIMIMLYCVSSENWNETRDTYNNEDI